MGPVDCYHDASDCKHHDAMRTTVTLESDVERLLKKAMAAEQRSFKETLNSAIRRGLADNVREVPPRYHVSPKPMGTQPGQDPSRLQDQASEDEVDAFLALDHRLRQHDRS